jgi:type I restriction enzyme S subunit
LGIAIPNVNATKLAKIKIPIAPENEQKRIVAEIEKQFSRLDEAVENLKRVKTNLKRYKASVLKAAVEGKLTEEWRKANPDVEPAGKLLERILAERRKKWEEAELAKMKAKGKEPENDKWKKKFKEPSQVDESLLPAIPYGWVWTSVDCLGEIVTGTTPSTKKKEYYGGDIPFFKPTELNQGYSVTSAAVYLTKVGAEKARLIPPHSVMVTCIGATIGKVGFSRVHGTTNQQLNSLIPDKKYLYSKYLYFACISPFFFKNIIDNASSTTLPIINKSKFAALPIMVPPFKEQIKIVDEIERCLSIIEKVYLAADVCKQRAGHLRQSILKKAFSGQLVSQDPIDEPAGKLLERIKAEREKLEDELRKKRKKTMTTKEKPKKKRDILAVLKGSEVPMRPEDLFRIAGYEPVEVDDFYADLKIADQQETISQTKKKNGEVFLRAV